MRPDRVFVYGTLQFPDVFEAVTGRRLRAIDAWLDGYARHQVKRAPYPAILPAPDARVHGLAVEGIDGTALARMDDFEGEMYRREPVTVVRAADGAALPAQAYVLRPRWRSRVADGDWDADAFARRWRAAYVRACSGASGGAP
jgi:gamma-glutamylcyclotransferase (GGCT)/AIG2-like uncharacterized protein YtfP